MAKVYPHPDAAYGTNPPLPANVPALDSTLLLDTVLATMPVGFAFFDPDLKYRRVNSALVAINGIADSDHIGRTIAEIPPGRVGEIERSLRLALRSRSAQTDIEVVGETPAFPGERRTWVVSHFPVTSTDNKVLGVGTLIDDVTAQKKAEQEVERKQRELLGVFECMSDGYYALDDAWRFTHLNSEAERLLRRRRADVVNRLIWDEVVVEESSQFAREHQRALRDQVKVSFTTYVAPLQLWMDVRAYPAGAGLGVYFRDISDQRREKQSAARLERELSEADARQRRFLREMLAAMTEGKLRLVDTRAELPAMGEPFGEPMILGASTLREVRHQVRAAAHEVEMPETRWQDLESAAGEACENAIVHAGGGIASLALDRAAGTVQVIVEDNGMGIEENKLHRATLERGFTTAGTMGHGFFFILRTADRVWLLTGKEGTTIVLEQEKLQPLPVWLRGN